MEPIVEQGIDLFDKDTPSIEDVQKLAAFVHSSEINKLNFIEKLEEHTARGGQKASLEAGIGLYIVGKYEEAVKKLQKGKDCEAKYIYLAFALRRLGQFDEAIENLERSANHGTSALNITLEKAATYRLASNFDSAARELRTASNFENVSAEYHYQLARLQEAQGLYKEAMDNYKTVLELSPDHQKALFRMAYRCDLSGDEDAAIDYYRQITQDSPVYVNTLLNLAVLYEDRGELNKASQSVDAVLKFHPNHQRANLFKKDIESSKTMFYDEEKEEKKTLKNQILETPISDFELSVRSRNCLKKMNITTLGDLLKISEVELLSYKNFGETSLREIKFLLDGKGLHLGMALEEKQLAASELDDLEISEDKDEELLSKTIDDLQLSVRSRKCLLKLNIRTLGELTRKTDAELLGCKNFGVTSLNEIKKILGNLGLFLRTLD